MEHRVYSDPSVEGAPKAGDIVVVVHDDEPGESKGRCTGRITRVLRTEGQRSFYRWVTAADWEDTLNPSWGVYGVRWPTPAELLQYQLSPDGRVTVEP